MKRSVWRMLIVGCGYAVIGVGTGRLAGTASSIPVRDAWRLAGWVLSALLFVADFAYDRLRVGGTPAASARRVSAAVAIGAFLLAAAGPVYSYWGTQRFWRVTVLSLVVWPLVTGMPAFVVALGGGALYRRLVARAERS